jgi:hypothetical protein
MPLYDGKTVFWYAMNAARIIGSITCGACLKGKIWIEMNNMFGVMHVCVVKLSRREQMQV